MFTIGLMYTHTVLDYEGDLKCEKMTLACRLGSKEKAINGVYIIYGLGFFFTIISAIVMKNYFMLTAILLFPLVVNLHNSLKSYECGGEVKEFYKRLLKARNLMVYYSLLIAISILAAK
jgi:1,4-dihydroxy-2-naphthoate octaprenyltransferase